MGENVRTGDIGTGEVVPETLEWKRMGGRIREGVGVTEGTTRNLRCAREGWSPGNVHERGDEP